MADEDVRRGAGGESGADDAGRDDDVALAGLAALGSRGTGGGAAGTLDDDDEGEGTGRGKPSGTSDEPVLNG